MHCKHKATRLRLFCRKIRQRNLTVSEPVQRSALHKIVKKYLPDMIDTGRFAISYITQAGKALRIPVFI